ncbi:MAG TPA: hypothetical protein PK954_18625 [Anaerolineales bacterium]|nr:hypothetical protein [Anaerolineales bacterium]HRF47107.1 hypothetical protein [Anaerolineales bacterium]
MNPCECVPRCIFFNDKMKDKPATADMMKRRYCQGDFEACARHRVFKALGPSQVPGDMFPSHAERADQILAAAHT